MFSLLGLGRFSFLVGCCLGAGSGFHEVDSAVISCSFRNTTLEYCAASSLALPGSWQLLAMHVLGGTRALHRPQVPWHLRLLGCRTTPSTLSRTLSLKT